MTAAAVAAAAPSAASGGGGGASAGASAAGAAPGRRRSSSWAPRRIWPQGAPAFSGRLSSAADGDPSSPRAGEQHLKRKRKKAKCCQ